MKDQTKQRVKKEWRQELKIRIKNGSIKTIHAAKKYTIIYYSAFIKDAEKEFLKIKEDI